MRRAAIIKGQVKHHQCRKKTKLCGDGGTWVEPWRMSRISFGGGTGEKVWPARRKARSNAWLCGIKQHALWTVGLLFGWRVSCSWNGNARGDAPCRPSKSREHSWPRVPDAALWNPHWIPLRPYVFLIGCSQPVAGRGKDTKLGLFLGAMKNFFAGWLYLDWADIAPWWPCCNYLRLCDSLECSYPALPPTLLHLGPNLHHSQSSFSLLQLLHLLLHRC